MTDDRNFGSSPTGDVTNTNLTITYTQIASCVVGDPMPEASRQSLRARLERERQEHERYAQQSFVNILRNLFCLAHQ